MVKIVAKTLVRDDKNNLLVLLRSAQDSYRPLEWDLPGGSVDEMEDPTEAATRETLEEAGLLLQNIRPIFVCSGQRHTQQVVTIVFQATAQSQKVALSHEHEQYKWVSPDEFLQLDIPDKYKQALKLSLDR